MLEPFKGMFWILMLFVWSFIASLLIYFLINWESMPNFLGIIIVVLLALVPGGIIASYIVAEEWRGLE